MKLIYKPLNLEFDLMKEKINSIVIENPEEFERIVIDIYDAANKRGEEIEYYSKGEKEIFNKNVEVIISPLDIAYNKKEIQKKIILELEKEITDNDIWENVARIYGELIEEMGVVQTKSEYNIEFSEELNIQKIIQAIEMEVNEPVGCFVERFFEYGSTVNSLLGKNIFVLVNCQAYLREKDYRYVEEWAKYRGICVILLNNQQKKLNIDINEYIIDMDLCEIH